MTISNLKYYSFTKDFILNAIDKPLTKFEDDTNYYIIDPQIFPLDFDELQSYLISLNTDPDNTTLLPGLVKYEPNLQTL